MKKLKRGFTLVELLAVIAILGVLSSGVIFSYSKYLKNAKERYYSSQENTVTLSGKEYFTDYRSRLPKEVGSKTSVDLDTLYSKKYISKLNDYNGKTCQTSTNSDANKVYAYKVADNIYVYYSIIDCNGYQTDVDTKGPVITFNPNKAITNQNINVVMSIKDNKKVEYYSYQIIKDGTIITTKNMTAYTSDITIPLRGEGTYKIKAQAVDSSGNLTDKTSNKYIIDKTVPDCSKINIKANANERTWQKNDIKLNIRPHSDIFKWSFRNCFKQSNGTGICKDDGSNIKGTSTKLLQGANGSLFSSGNYTYNGHVYGKIIAYDEAGNSCSVNTGEYYIDREPPTIKNVSVTSRNSNYNSLNVVVKFTLTDRTDTTNNKIYYSVSSSGSTSWTEYPLGSSSVSVNLTLNGSYDGATRKITIKAKDELGNTRSLIYANYTVYKDCNYTYSSSYTGSCSATTGFGTATKTTKFYDRYTNNYCSSKTENVSCCINPSVTRGSWSSCSASCGGGTRTRNVTTRNCDGSTSYSTERESCNMQSCTCENVYYRDGSSCSSSCGSGTYNQLAYDYYTDQRCYSKDRSSGGSSCYSTSSCSTTCDSVYYRDGSSCSSSCGSGTYNQLAYDYYTDQRCYSKDKSSGGSYCSSTSGCSTPTTSCTNVNYRDGTTCSNSCGKGTYNQFAYDSSTGQRCSSKDKSSGGSSCSSTSGCTATAKATCSITLSGGTKGNNGWYKGGTVKATLKTNGESITDYGINGQSGEKTTKISSDGKHTITGYVKNPKGKSTCSIKVKYDSTPPYAQVERFVKYRGSYCPENTTYTFGYRYHLTNFDDTSEFYKTDCITDTASNVMHPVRTPNSESVKKQQENFCTDKKTHINCSLYDMAGNVANIQCRIDGTSCS